MGGRYGVSIGRNRIAQDKENLTSCVPKCLYPQSVRIRSNPRKHKAVVGKKLTNQSVFVLHLQGMGVFA